jgi:hypothetical protein
MTYLLVTDPVFSGRIPMGLRHWQCRASGDSDILCTKRQQSGKDSVIEGQPLLLFMLWAGD